MKVDIGMPVFNGEETLARALSSLLAQTHADFTLHVSDNASTDETPAILADFARRDPRVRLHRQERNIGAHPNFGFVLRLARAPYFLWAAADDCWEPGFLEANLGFLEQHPDYVSSITDVRFEDDGGRFRGRMGTFALEGSVRQNLRAYLWRPQFNSRYYGLHRRQALQACWDDEPFWCSDWALMARLIVQGRFAEIGGPALVRSSRGASSDWRRALRTAHASRFERWLPMHRYLRHMAHCPEVRAWPELWLPLLWWEARGVVSLLQSAWSAKP